MPSPSPFPIALNAIRAGQLHEIHASAQDWPAALAFAIASIAADRTAPLVLVRNPRRAGLRMTPYGEGLQALGIDPGRMLIVEAGDDLGVLRAGLEAARCPNIAALVMESWGKMAPYDLTASRRLVLAAERSGVPLFMLRLGTDMQAPSAAHSRWLVESSPSAPMAAKACGAPAIRAQLLRQRGGPAGQVLQLEWNDEDAAFRERGQNPAPLSGLVVPMALYPKGANRAA